MQIDMGLPTLFAPISTAQQIERRPTNRGNEQRQGVAAQMTLLTPEAHKSLLHHILGISPPIGSIVGPPKATAPRRYQTTGANQKRMKRRRTSEAVAIKLMPNKRRRYQYSSLFLVFSSKKVSPK